MMRLLASLFWPRTRPHPQKKPRFREPLNPEGLKAVFSGCDDLIFRPVRLGGAEGALTCTLCCLDGLTDADAVSGEVLRPLTESERFGAVKEVSQAVKDLEEGLAYFHSVKTRKSLDETAGDVLNGWCALVFDGVAVTFETRKPQGRGIEKSEMEKAVKGAKDAFSESFRLNTALLRQRVRSTELKLEEMTVGRRTRTKVAMVYIAGLTSRAVVEELRRRLGDIDIDGVLTTGSLEEYLLPSTSPFPQINVTERPDRFARELLEGRAGVLADGLPLGFLMQGTLAEQVKVTEDSAGHWVLTSLLTLLRYGAMLLSVLLPAVYVAVTVYHQEMLPTKLMLSIIRTRQDVPFSTAAEILGMLLAFELLQEAGLRLPKSVGETVSIIGALIVGQSAVEAKVISPIVVIVVALAGICGYTTPNQDLAAALRLCRLALVLLGLGLGIFGLVFGLILLTYYLCTLESFGTAYLAPFCGGSAGELLRALVRLPLPKLKERPAALHPEDVRNQK
jgi:spore germination protein KA